MLSLDNFLLNLKKIKMAQQRKGKGVAVVLSMVAIAGVVGYILYRRYKKKKDEMPSIDTGLTSTSTSTSSSGSTSGGSTSNSNPFATKDDLIKFQQWVINTKGDKTILGKGGSTGFGDDGIWGSNSAKAFAKYGTEYKNSASTSSGWNEKGSIKSTENGVNVWKDLKFTKPYGTTAGSQLQKNVSGKYMFSPIPSGAYFGEATGVIVTDSSGVQYREVVAPSDKQDLFKDSNNQVVSKAYVSRKKTTKY
jgi:hypothetical protein